MANYIATAMIFVIGSGSFTSPLISLPAVDVAYRSRSTRNTWFCSTDEGLRPDAVLVGIGTGVTFGVIAAAKLLRKLAPEFRVRVANVTDLTVLEPFSFHSHALSVEDFEHLFTKDRRMVVNYHGYSHDVAGLVFGRECVKKMRVEGYRKREARRLRST